MKIQKTKLFRNQPSQDVLNSMAVQLAKVKALDLISKIVERMQNKGCTTTYILVFKGFDEDTRYDIEDVLDSLGIEYNLLEEGEDYGKYEVISPLSLRALRKTIYKNLKKKGIRIRTESIEGKTIIFVPRS